MTVREYDDNAIWMDAPNGIWFKRLALVPTGEIKYEPVSATECDFTDCHFRNVSMHMHGVFKIVPIVNKEERWYLIDKDTPDGCLTDAARIAYSLMKGDKNYYWESKILEFNDRKVSNPASKILDLYLERALSKVDQLDEEESTPS